MILQNKGVTQMNDNINNNTKPKNITELFQILLKNVTKIYDAVVPNSVRNRKNKMSAKMSDPEIITIYLLIQCLGDSINKGYQFLMANFPTLVNYVERSRFNRLVNALMTVIRAIRQHFMKFQHSIYKIVDSFPLTTSKFGRALFSKLFKGLASYGYCASKKEHYFGFKVHVITDLDGNPYDYILTSANVDDREAVYELSDLVDMDILFGDKGYIGSLAADLKKEKDIKLYALQRSNSKNPLPKEFRNLISHLRRRIESTFNQLIENFDIERVRSKSMLGLQTSLEIKFLCFNLLVYINNGDSHISDILCFN